MSGRDRAAVWCIITVGLRWLPAALVPQSAQPMMEESSDERSPEL